MTAEAVELGRERDRLADEIERCRRDWHAARTAVDATQRDLRERMRAQVMAELAYRAAVAAYEAGR